MQMSLVCGEPSTAIFPAKFAAKLVEIDHSNTSETPSPYGHDPPDPKRDAVQSAPSLAVPRKPPDPDSDLGAHQFEPVQYGAQPPNKPANVITTNVNNLNIEHNKLSEKLVDRAVASYIIPEKTDKQTDFQTVDIRNNQPSSRSLSQPTQLDTHTFSTTADPASAPRIRTSAAPLASLSTPASYPQESTLCDMPANFDEEDTSETSDADQDSDTDRELTTEDLLQHVDDAMEDVLVKIHGMVPPVTWLRQLLTLFKQLRQSLHEWTDPIQLMSTLFPTLVRLQELAASQDDIDSEAIAAVTCAAIVAAHTIQQVAITQHSANLLKQFDGLLKSVLNPDCTSIDMPTAENSLVTINSHQQTICEEHSLAPTVQLTHASSVAPATAPTIASTLVQEPTPENNDIGPCERLHTSVPQDISSYCNEVSTGQQCLPASCEPLSQRLWSMVQSAPEEPDLPQTYPAIGSSIAAWRYNSGLLLNVSVQAPNTWARYLIPCLGGYKSVTYFKPPQDDGHRESQLEEALFANPLPISDPTYFHWSQAFDGDMMETTAETKSIAECSPSGNFSNTTASKANSICRDRRDASSESFRSVDIVDLVTAILQQVSFRLITVH
jgi:hypothetical protein